MTEDEASPDDTASPEDTASPDDTATRHLQAAARELIAAARAFLDVAEEVLDDPGTVEEAGEVVKGFMARFIDGSRSGSAERPTGHGSGGQGSGGQGSGGQGSGGGTSGADAPVTGEDSSSTVDHAPGASDHGGADAGSPRPRRASGRVTRIEVE